ncbi:MAG: hypothetical protein RJQ09_10110 [Cyclobacteriaceae bacterium]
MKRISLTILFVATLQNLFAQEDALRVKDVQRSLGSAGSISTIPTGMRTIPLKPEEMKGDFYLNKEFEDMIVVIAEQDQYQVSAKYNVQNNVFVVQRGNDLNSLDGKLVQAFTYADDLGKYNFLNSARYPFNPMEASPGFYEILFKGEKSQLLSRARIQIVEANYNVALDVGDRAGRIEVIKRYYVYQDGMFSELRSLKRKHLNVFGNKANEMQRFIRDNKIQHNNENDLIRLMSRYEEVIQ